MAGERRQEAQRTTSEQSNATQPANAQPENAGTTNATTTTTTGNGGRVASLRKAHVNALRSYISLFEKKSARVEAYKQDSKNAVSVQELSDVWEFYIAGRDRIIQEDQEMLSTGNLSKEEQNDIKSDLDAVKQYNQHTSLKKFKEDMHLVEVIEKSNARIKGLVDETDEEKDTGNVLVEDYLNMAAKYQEEGKIYPEPEMLERAKEHGKKVQKNQELLEHKVTSKKSKSNDASDDIKKLYVDKKDEYIKMADILVKAVDNHKPILDEMLLLKMGNEEFDREYSKIKAIYDEGKEADTEYNKKTVTFDSEKKKENGETEVEEKELLTQRKQEQYDTIRKTARSLRGEKEEIHTFSKKIKDGTIKLSADKMQLWTQLRADVHTFKRKTAKDAKTRYKTLTENSKMLNRSENVPKIKSVCVSLRTNLKTKLDEYLPGKKKIFWEHQAEKGTGIVADIESMYEEYENLVPIISTNMGAEEAKNATEMMASYEKFQQAREISKGTYQRVKPYLGGKSSRNMIVRLVRRAKMIENSKGGELFGSEYDGAASKMLGGLEKVEEMPKDLAKKGLSAMGMKDEQIQDYTVELGGMAGSEMLKTPGEALEFDDSLVKAKGLKEDDGGVFSHDLSKSDGRYGFALNIMSTASAAFDLLKGILAAAKEWKGGVDGREVGKRVLDLSNQAVALFDSISGFFNLDIPILSTIKSGLTIVLKVMDLVRSSGSQSAISEKKKELREKVSQGKGYRLKSSKTKDAAKKSGYDTRGAKLFFGNGGKVSTAARMYAQENIQEDAYRHKYGSAYEQLAVGEGETDKEKRASRKAEKKRREQEVAEDKTLNRDAVTGSMHSRMHQLRALHGGNVEEMSKKERREYDALDRISTMHEYDILTEAKVRMENKKKDDWKTILEEGWSIVSSFLKITPSPAAVGAVIADIVIALGNKTREFVAKDVSAYRDATGNMYSERNKKERRSKMAANFYDRMIVASGIVDESGQIDIENHDGWEIDEAAGHMDALYFDLAKGLDAYISHIIECKTKDEMIEQMSSAFSVAGN